MASIKAPVTFLLITVSSFKSFGQIENSIDKELNKCLLDSAGEFGRQQCLRAATEKWTANLQKHKYLILEIIEPEKKIVFKEADRCWEEYKTNELLLL